jgi:hypothetical protein
MLRLTRISPLLPLAPLFALLVIIHFWIRSGSPDRFRHLEREKIHPLADSPQGVVDMAEGVVDPVGMIVSSPVPVERGECEKEGKGESGINQLLRDGGEGGRLVFELRDQLHVHVSGGREEGGKECETERRVKGSDGKNDEPSLQDHTLEKSMWDDDSGSKSRKSNNSRSDSGSDGGLDRIGVTNLISDVEASFWSDSSESSESIGVSRESTGDSESEVSSGSSGSSSSVSSWDEEESRLGEALVVQERREGV